jgi:hypothetical protein
MPLEPGSGSRPACDLYRHLRGCAAALDVSLCRARIDDVFDAYVDRVDEKNRAFGVRGAG